MSSPLSPAEQVDALLRHMPAYYTHLCFSWIDPAGCWCTQTISRLSTRDQYSIPTYALHTPCYYDYHKEQWVYVLPLPTEDQLLDARFAWLEKKGTIL